MTRTLIVAGAIATRDYQDVHHDPEAARRRGAPDVFMNILTTNGLVGRYLTESLGAGTVLRTLAIRLGTPSHPGDTLVLRGTVVSRAGDDAVIRVVGTHERGTHVTARATVTLPPAARAPVPEAPPPEPPEPPELLKSPPPLGIPEVRNAPEQPVTGGGTS
ncbi:hotdog family protein [Streptomyces yaizuensis]|uniref:MaoC family dehydratase n=1 Tax=Streptomyces yaizuensis TaxID=2989713 RepID=A0ABQ5P0Q0_9ACTN|nr:acyl dehydratase [Streptomyces sp. YSPA8]GLF95796.1 MaoC family dehydratase [Streptomyces sp. YSPA8]